MKTTALAAATLFVAQALAAQTPAPAPAPAPPSNTISCLPTGQPLQKLPEIVSKNGVLRGQLYAVSEQQRMTFRNGKIGVGNTQCYPQWVRAYRVDPPPPNPPSSQLTEPLPGPVLRARVGDLVELAFLNQIDSGKFPNADKGCDQTTTYVGTTGDSAPDCFSGSVFTNVHFHGTHTNPNTTGDNVFLQIRPSPRTKDASNAPTVTWGTVGPIFDAYFKDCESHLNNPKSPQQWPAQWEWDTALPQAYRDLQRNLLMEVAPQEWAIDQKQKLQGKWPQFYVGAYPYCFRLPDCQSPDCPGKLGPAASTPHTHGQSTAEKDEASQPTRPLIMGQAPGTHWYHAHKHGSTTINVMNGMTGVFIIEGDTYDGWIDQTYGAGWTRTQPVIVVNQLGTSPSLERGAGGGPGPDFSVNGRLLPATTMKPGEVQMWRIANTSARAGVYLEGPPSGFHWMRTGQDGVQLTDDNFQASKDQSFVVAAGNRIDLLVKAPPLNSDKTKNTYRLIVYNTVDETDRPPIKKDATPLTLFTINVAGTAADMPMMTHMPKIPDYLTDIKDSEIKGTKELAFASTAPVFPGNPAAQHTIDGKKFDGEVGVSVLLNRAEEWKVTNGTYGPLIAHPFHIHINPFQLTEIFDPNSQFPDPSDPKKLVPRYVFTNTTPLITGQCYVNPDDQSTWKPCNSAGIVPPGQRVWWDVFPIPAGVATKNAAGTTVNIPGYFKMRSRFVDYAGYYVLHCHILAHEDRGMMTVVEVSPLQTPYGHHN